MNIIIDLTNPALFGSKYAGKSLPQRAIDAVSYCKYTQRAAICTTDTLRPLISGSWISLPQLTFNSDVFTLIVSEAVAPSDAIIHAMRKMGWQDAVLVDPATPVFGFMLDEVALGAAPPPGITRINWISLVRDGGPTNTAVKLSDQQLEYVFTEMDAGAAWDELMDDLNEQEDVSIQHEH